MTSNLNDTKESRSHLARNAYASGDIEESRRVHEKNLLSEEHHQEEGGNIKTITLGGLDGCLTAFAIVTASVAGGIPWQGVLAMGFANIFADAFSMGIGEYLSEKAQNEYILQEKEREEWEFDKYPEGEINEMIQLYTEKGMDEKEARKVIEILAKYRELFIDIMMVEELELQVPEETWKSETMCQGVVMFFGFLVFGAIPLLGYIILPIADPTVAPFYLMLFSVICTLLSLFLLGALRGITGVGGWILPGLETAALGIACAGLAYGVSTGVKSALGVTHV